MALFLGLLIFSFIVTSVAVVPFINLLYRWKFTRKVEAPRGKRAPLFDRLHDWKAGTAVGGGPLIIALVSLLYAILFPLLQYLGVYVTGVYPVRDEVSIIFFSFISFGLLGLCDDLMKFSGRTVKGVLGLKFGLPQRVKFPIGLVLALTIAALLYFNLRIDSVHLPLTDITLDLGWWYLPFAAFVIVSFANALNITDGLDGLASGLLMICLFAFSILSATMLDTALSVFLSLWIGAIIAFLYFNIYPARIWLGDSGALSFGATLAVVSLVIGNIITLVVIGGIFVLEVATSVIQMIALRVLHRRLFRIAPFHLWLQARGWEEPKIVSRLWLAGLMLAIVGIWLDIV